MTLVSPATVTASVRRSIPTHGVHLRVASGTLAGWWVHEDALAYVPGITGSVTYSPVPIRLAQGRQVRAVHIRQRRRDDGRQGPPHRDGDHDPRGPGRGHPWPPVHPDRRWRVGRLVGAGHPDGADGHRLFGRLAAHRENGPHRPRYGHRRDRRDRPHLRHGRPGDAGARDHAFPRGGAGLRDDLPDRLNRADAYRSCRPRGGHGPSGAVRAGQPHRPPLQPARRRRGCRVLRRTALVGLREG